MMTLRGLCPALVVSALLLISANGFSPNTQTTTRVSTLLFSEVPSRDNTAVLSDAVSRRDLLAVSLGSIAVASGWKWQSDSTQSLLTTETKTDNNYNRQILSSVEEALAVIDSQCDRRFLHALVATDYQLLYRSVENLQESKQASTVTLDGSATNQVAPKSTDFRAALESTSLVEDYKGSAPFHLTVTNRQAMGSKAMSLWPLGNNVHFAWPEQEQDLLWSKSRGSLVANPPKSIIVDGVDCGVMSLEDALERPKGQVMVHSNSFLLVPAFMEQELISRLKESFII